MLRTPLPIFDDLLDEILEDERAAVMQTIREQTHENVEPVDK